MRMDLRLVSLAACAGIVASAGCGNGNPQAQLSSVSRSWPRPNAGAAAGLYAADFDAYYAFGYPARNRQNGPPVCRAPAKTANNIAVDGRGNLLVPDSYQFTVVVFQGPAMCGALLRVLKDPYGMPTDAASNDAINGKIVVANYMGMSTGADGNLAICTLAAGCASRLTNPHMHSVAGVAVALNGDCWASSQGDASTATLIYFRRCSGPGVVASGFRNPAFGGLDIDNDGNIVAISAPSSLYVYKGCKPKCTLVGGPFALHYTVLYGHLNEDNSAFAVGNDVLSRVDVYRYNPKHVSFWYSFDNGFGPGDEIEGAAYDPRSKESRPGSGGGRRDRLRVIRRFCGVSHQPLSPSAA